MKKQRIFRLLLVDDDDIFAMLFRESIAEHADLRDSFVCHRVSDGDEALEYLRNACAEDESDAVRPDIILLDQRMPRMDGTAVLTELRKSDSTCSIPVCMLSTSNQPRQVATCYERGANFCITKPGNLEELIEKLGHLLFFFANVVEVPAAATVPATS